MAATTTVRKQAAKKAAETRRASLPPPGHCRFKMADGSYHGAKVPKEHPNWTWCREHVDQANAAKREMASAVREAGKITTRRAQRPAVQRARPAARTTAKSGPARRAGRPRKVEART